MNYDVIIIGGGINGCGLFRDLAINGVKTLLLEKGDFSSQTSQSSSKMLHGGIRYLENFDFSLVQEALEEKNLWLKLAPHLCFEREFYLPIYNYSKYPPLMLHAGLFLYDFLSHFQNRPYEMLSPQETIKAIPSIDPKGLKGAGKYFDGIVDDAKLALECLYDGLLEEGNEALSYNEVIATNQTTNGYQVICKDQLNGKTQSFSSTFVVFLTGPFTDQLLPKLRIPWKPQLALSKGIHLWLKPDAIKTEGSVVLTTKDNRVVFVIPQRNAILVGTTETSVSEEIFDIQSTQSDKDYLIDVLKQYFPLSEINHSDIISTFAGVRPLARENGSGNNLGKVSRHHKIFRPTSHSYVMIGGKYTTFRKMNQELAREIVPRIGKTYYPNLTLNPLRQLSLYPTFGSLPKISIELIKEIIKKERVRTFNDLVKRRLSSVEDSNKFAQLHGIDLNEVHSLFS